MKLFRWVSIVGLVTVVLGPGTAVAQGQAGENWLEVQKLISSDDLTSQAAFGHSVSVLGERAVIGVPSDDSDGFQKGLAYVFERGNDGVWSEVQKLVASDREDGDEFGVSVAMGVDTLLVGAWQDDDNDSNSGSVYVFERDPTGTWIEVQKLWGSDSERSDHFGQVVAISGEIAVVASERDDEILDTSGAAYVFARDPTGRWVEIQKLLAPEGGIWDGEAKSVDIDGDTIVIGAGDSGPGSVHVFEPDVAGVWSAVQRLVPTDGVHGDLFGASLSLSDGTLVVGAWLNDELEKDAGAAYVFEQDADGLWSESGKILAADGAGFDKFGFSVAASAETVLVGAYAHDVFILNHGAVYAFEKGPDGEWYEVQSLLASDGSSWDHFGWSLGISGSTALVGADGASPSGAAYVLERQGCALGLDLSSDSVRAGDPLTVRVSLTHRRLETAVVPIRFWIEDEDGAVLLTRSTRPLTFRRGESVDEEATITVPSGAPAGRYRVLVGADEMQQGVAWGSAEFEVDG